LSEIPVVRSFRVSLQAKLLAVILLCALVPVLGIGAYLMQLNQKTLGEKVSENLDSHLLRRGAALNAWMGERHKEAARWSASFVVYEGLESLSGPAASPRAKSDLVEYLASLLAHYRVYESLFIVDPQGKVVAATREERLEDWALMLLPATASSTSTIVSPVKGSVTLGRPTMLILQPIAPGLEGRGKVIGYFVMRLDLRELEAVLSEDATPVIPAAWLLDGNGGVIARAGKIAASPGEPFPVNVGEARPGRTSRPARSTASAR
jgi:hypothetical protein